MASNPLLGSRISLISKKNIRYEGTLYSINEADATVALQNVRAYGTEGRETESESFVPPQDQVHPYLLFRGCDIKDLHVHESSMQPPSDPAIVSANQPKEEEVSPAVDGDTGKESEDQQQVSVRDGADDTRLEETRDTAPPELSSSPQNENSTDPANTDDAKGQRAQTGASKPNQSTNNRRKKIGAKSNKQMVGSGASLLNRKARGVVDAAVGPDKNMEHDFDFETKLAEFEKTNEESDYEEESDDAMAYSKDDFFDSLSNDVMDRKSGVDHRLRGAEERSLNTETFGATSLGHRRYRRRGGRDGRGRGRGRGRGGRAGRGRGGRGRQYGDGGISQVQTNNRWRN